MCVGGYPYEFLISATIGILSIAAYVLIGYKNKNYLKLLPLLLVWLVLLALFAAIMGATAKC